MLINHLSAPNVTIASAVMASSAVPGFIHPVRLQYKDAHGTIRGYGEHDQTYYDGTLCFVSMSICVCMFCTILYQWQYLLTKKVSFSWFLLFLRPL